MVIASVSDLLGSACEVALTVRFAGFGMAVGAVYVTVEPVVALSPPHTGLVVQSVLFWLRLQFTAVLNALPTVAVKVVVCGGHPATNGHRLTVVLGLTVTLTVWMFTVALPDRPSDDVAVAVNVAGVVHVVGAVYMPVFLSIVPAAPAPLRAQVTVVFELNC
jgi:hypothetical protein